MWDHKKQCIHQSPGTCQGQDSHCTLLAGNTACHVIWHTHSREMALSGHRHADTHTVLSLRSAGAFDSRFPAGTACLHDLWR